MPMLMRRYRQEDGPAVRALFVEVNRAMAPPQMRAAFEGYIERSLREEIDRIEAYYAERRGSFWIAEDGHALLGIFGLERADAGSMELRRMYVAPAARRRGVARKMLAQAERICLEDGGDRLILSTSELQPEALQLYRTAGYVQVREEIAETATNKTLGSGLRRFHFEKVLRAQR